MIRKFKLPPSVERDTEVWLSLARLREFCERAAEEAKDPSLGLHGNHALSIMVLRGTNDGPFPGAPAPTHQKIGLAMAHLVDFDEAGKIKTEWILYDTLTLLGQLGLDAKKVRDVRASPDKPAEPVEAKGTALEKENLAHYQDSVDAFNAHDFSRFRAVLADGLVWSEPNLPQDLGASDVGAETEDLWRGFSNLRRTPGTVWAAGDFVVASGTMKGTNDGPCRTFAADATGKSIDATYIEITRFAAGKRDRSWLIYNGIVVREQLGM